MKDVLSNLLKKYVGIFVKEYASLLNKEQLETLREIDYENIIAFEDLNNPFGLINLGKIYLSNSSNDLIHNLEKMPDFNTSRYFLNNRNLTSYLKYMCTNGYTITDYYNDILMYFVFKLVIKNNSGIIDGLINQEIKYLSIKYSLRFANIYAREEAITSKITNFLGIDNMRKILFLDSVSAFKYLNEKLGYRYATLFYEIEKMVEDEYGKLKVNDYKGFNGIVDYVNDYDKILYGNVYNYLLDFEVMNNNYSQICE